MYAVTQSLPELWNGLGLPSQIALVALTILATFAILYGVQSFDDTNDRSKRSRRK